MLIRADAGAPFAGWTVSAKALANLVVAGAVVTSAIVFSEPAIADALMGGVIIAIPVLNAGWLGGLLYAVSVMATLIVDLRAALSNGALQGGFVVATAAFAGLVVEGFVIDSDHWRHFFIVMACIWGLADTPPRDRPFAPPRRSAR
jgi:hypothetical protein